MRPGVAAAETFRPSTAEAAGARHVVGPDGGLNERMEGSPGRPASPKRIAQRVMLRRFLALGRPHRFLGAHQPRDPPQRFSGRDGPACSGAEVRRAEMLGRGQLFAGNSPPPPPPGVRPPPSIQPRLNCVGSRIKTGVTSVLIRFDPTGLLDNSRRASTSVCVQAPKFGPHAPGGGGGGMAALIAPRPRARVIADFSFTRCGEEDSRSQKDEAGLVGKCGK